MQAICVNKVLCSKDSYRTVGQFYATLALHVSSRFDLLVIGFSFLYDSNVNNFETNLKHPSIVQIQ